MLTRNRGSKRFSTRKRNGRFVRATLRNTFGIDPGICPHCRAFNPSAFKEVNGFVEKVFPEKCHACGRPLNKEAEENVNP
jgi:hypothetical protein